jgi:hypothetical protein
VYLWSSAYLLFLDGLILIFDRSEAYCLSLLLMPFIPYINLFLHIVCIILAIAADDWKLLLFLVGVSGFLSAHYMEKADKVDLEVSSRIRKINKYVDIVVFLSAIYFAVRHYPG